MCRKVRSHRVYSWDPFTAFAGFSSLAGRATLRLTPPVFAPAIFLFCLPLASATSLSVFTKRRWLDGQKVKTSGVDSGRCSHLENRRQKENTSTKHCSISKANRGRYSAKGIQPGAVPRFSRLMLGLFGFRRVKPRRSAGLSTRSPLTIRARRGRIRVIEDAAHSR